MSENEDSEGWTAAKISIKCLFRERSNGKREFRFEAFDKSVSLDSSDDESDSRSRRKKVKAKRLTANDVIPIEIPEGDTRTVYKFGKNPGEINIFFKDESNPFKTDEVESKEIGKKPSVKAAVSAEQVEEVLKTFRANGDDEGHAILSVYPWGTVLPSLDGKPIEVWLEMKAELTKGGYHRIQIDWQISGCRKNTSGKTCLAQYMKKVGIDKSQYKMGPAFEIFRVLLRDSEDRCWSVPLGMIIPWQLRQTSRPQRGLKDEEEIVDEVQSPKRQKNG